MESQESKLNSLLERIGYRGEESASKEDVLIIYYSRVTLSNILCNIGKIDDVLYKGNKLGDSALKNHIEAKIEENDRKIASGVSNAMTL